VTTETRAHVQMQSDILAEFRSKTRLTPNEIGVTVRDASSPSRAGSIPVDNHLTIEN